MSIQHDGPDSPIFAELLSTYYFGPLLYRYLLCFMLLRVPMYFHTVPILLIFLCGPSSILPSALRSRMFDNHRARLPRPMEDMPWTLRIAFLYLLYTYRASGVLILYSCLDSVYSEPEISVGIVS